jgi:murein DD-endopeptidase MepM/ murein hydrolase activator NlpD
LLALACACGLLLSQPGCAGKRPGGPGVIHHVQSGENLYRLGLRYGVPAREIARANGIRDVTALSVGQRLFIPGARQRLGARSSELARRSPGSSSPGLSGDTDAAKEKARALARDQGGLKFLWPVRGRLSSSFGMRRGRPHEGVDIAAQKGTPIFAAESGRVIYSGRMSGYGKVVIVKHAGRYRSVYAHASRLLVRKGEFVERGQKVAEVGSTGRSTGPHLHFEIRRSETPQNPLAYLP